MQVEGDWNSVIAVKKDPKVCTLVGGIFFDGLQWERPPPSSSSPLHTSELVDVSGEVMQQARPHRAETFTRRPLGEQRTVRMPQVASAIPD